MRKAIVLAGAALFVAVGAAYPDKPKLAYADEVFIGSGGPYEEIADSEATRWPPCRPGPGDDRCIQLYERGVRTAYAQWLAEPVAAKPDHLSPAALGGPIEARTAYPPCNPGPGDDRCIQLYERGVSGRGN